MSFFRETPKTITLYFGICGAAGLLLSCACFSFMRGEPSAGSVGGYLWLASMAVTGVFFLYFAFALPKYLNPTRVKYPKVFLGILIALGLMDVGTGLLTQATGFAVVGVFRVLLISYLYANICRLSTFAASDLG